MVCMGIALVAGVARLPSFLLESFRTLASPATETGSPKNPFLATVSFAVVWVSAAIISITSAQAQNSSFNSNLDDGPWQTFQQASSARPMMVSPQTGQLVPAPTTPLPSIGDVPQFSTPAITRPLNTPAFNPPFENPTQPPALPGSQAFTDDFFSSPAQPSGPYSSGQAAPTNSQPFPNPNSNPKNRIPK